jgi:hypothetical protein
LQKIKRGRLLVALKPTLVYNKSKDFAIKLWTSVWKAILPSNEVFSYSAHQFGVDDGI